MNRALRAWRGGLALAAVAIAQPALAGIVSTSGDVEVIDAPESVRGGQFEGSVARLFQEHEGIILTDSLMVDAVSGSASLFEDVNPTLLSAGLTVDSYYVHVDPVGTTPISTMFTVTFDGPILGVIVSGEHLFASDAMLGAAGTAYPGHGRSGRGLDLDSPDAFSISEDQTTLTLEILRTGKVFDQVRVIVGQPIPGPGGAALLGAVAVFGSRRRR
ncbi:MAG: hypothetical protein AAF995_02525 [Planctomycetota bacterium]